MLRRIRFYNEINRWYRIFSNRFWNDYSKRKTTRANRSRNIKNKTKKIDNNASIDWLIKPPEGLHLTRFDTSQTGITEQDLMHGIDAKRAMRIIDKSCSKKRLCIYCTKC